MSNVSDFFAWPSCAARSVTRTPGQHHARVAVPEVVRAVDGDSGGAARPSHHVAGDVPGQSHEHLSGGGAVVGGHVSAVATITVSGTATPPSGARSRSSRGGCGTVSR